jgi:hypothetical protein
MPPLEESIERPPRLDAPPRPVRNGLLAFAAAAVWLLLRGSIGWSIGLFSSQAPGDLLLLIGGVSIICLLPLVYLMLQQADLLVVVLVPVLLLAVVLRLRTCFGAGWVPPSSSSWCSWHLLHLALPDPPGSVHDCHQNV